MQVSMEFRSMLLWKNILSQMPFSKASGLAKIKKNPGHQIFQINIKQKLLCCHFLKIYVWYSYSYCCPKIAVADPGGGLRACAPLFGLFLKKGILCTYQCYPGGRGF